MLTYKTNDHIIKAGDILYCHFRPFREEDHYIHYSKRTPEDHILTLFVEEQDGFLIAEDEKGKVFNHVDDGLFMGWDTYDICFTYGEALRCFHQEQEQLKRCSDYLRLKHMGRRQQIKETYQAFLNRQ